MNSPRWCLGNCGDSEICSDQTYWNGYCVNPNARATAVKLNEVVGREVIKKKPPATEGEPSQ